MDYINRGFWRFPYNHNSSHHLFLSDLWIKGASAFFLYLLFSHGVRNRCDQRRYSPPAATLAIIHEYRAKGPFTSILLGVVALDDGLTIIFAAFAITIAQTFVNQEAITWYNFLLSPIFSILISMSIGGALGVCLRKLIPFISRGKAMLGIIIGSIFLVSGLAISLKVSPLLANMMLGFVVANLVEHPGDIFTLVESIEEPIFAMFFTLAGAHLDLRVMQTAGWIALLISLGRFSGKILGVRFGAQISHAPQTVKKYLSLALLPTAGVTVGLVLEASVWCSASQLFRK